MITDEGPFNTVKPVERFKEFGGQLPIYACRVVEKTSSKGKKLRRVLLVSSTFVALASTKIKRVRRVVLLRSIHSAVAQKDATSGALSILLKLNDNVNEPDMLFEQVEVAEDPHPAVRDGSDLLNIINWRRKAITGDDLKIQDLTGSPKLGASNCNLRKSSSYEAVQWKLVRGDYASESVAESTPSLPETPVKDRNVNSSFGSQVSQGKGTYTMVLADPNAELGLDYEEEKTPVQRVLLVKVDPRSPAGAANIPRGVLHTLNGHRIETSHHLRTVVTQLRTSRITTYTFHITPLPDFAAPGHPGGNKLLAIGIGYLNTTHELRNSAAETHSVVKLMESLKFTTPDNTKVLTEEPNTTLPTKANIIKALKWLVSSVGPGDSLFLCFVGHCMQQGKHEARDGPSEAMYPSDFNQRGGGVISSDELRHLIVDPLPAGSKLTVICDACSAGTLLNLSYKLKATPEGGSRSTFQDDLPAPAAKILQLSSWKSPSSKSGPVIASGAIASGFCTAFSRDAEPTFENLLHTVLQVANSKVGAGGQTPQVSCSWRASSNERFCLSLRRGALRSAQASPPAAVHGQPAGSPPRMQSPSQQLSPGPASYGRSPRGSVQSPARIPMRGAQWQAGGMDELAQQQGFPTALRPDELLAKIPHTVLHSPGLSKLMSVQWQNGVPEIFYTAEAVCLESRNVASSQNAYDSTVLWPNAKLLFVGRKAIYVLDPSGEVDRCIPLSDLHDFVLFKNGGALDKVLGAAKGPSMLPPGTVGQQWLAARVPSQYELLMQPLEKGDARNSLQSLLSIVNCLMQQAAGEPAKVMVVDNDGAPGMLRLQRPHGYSFPWIPLNIRIWPAGQPEHGAAGPISRTPVTFSRRNTRMTHGDPNRALAV